MENLLYLVGPLGCALMMAVCMGTMAKGMRRKGTGEVDATAEDVSALRAEVARLRGGQPDADALVTDHPVARG